MSKMNVYKIDDKYYAKKIKHAECNKLVNNEYYLECDIKMRGSHSYTYIRGNDYLIKDAYMQDGIILKNLLYLEEDALNTVINSINEMDKYIELLNNKGFKYKDNILYYERRDSTNYFFIAKTDDTYEYYIENIYRNNYHDYKSREELINNSIYYLAAKYYNDEIFMLELLVRENIATNEECRRLSELTGRIILPKADIKYNKTFVVNRDSIDDDVLYQSGYRILHRPYFAMKGSTHSKWELNPYTKSGVDATMKDLGGIDFVEFIIMLK